MQNYDYEIKWKNNANKSGFENPWTDLLSGFQ